MTSNPRISRRDFLKTGVGTLALTPLANIVKIVSPDLVVERIVAPVDNLPGEFEGFRLGLLTDIHLSAFLPTNLLEDALMQLAREDLDLVLFAGDYLWHPREMLRGLYPVYRKEFAELADPSLPHNLYRHLLELAASTVHPRYGIKAVMGNHDHWLEPFTFNKLIDKSPIELLSNKVSTISVGQRTLEIHGCDDYLTGCPRITPSDQPREDAIPRILLTHNPDILPWYFTHSPLKFSLACLGHTHGGQICPLPGVALSYNIKNIQFGVGLNQHQSGCWCYTSRGLGTVGVPIRVNCPPEVSIITLTNASSS